jgi:sulfonate transport system ATP-binding protein
VLLVTHDVDEAIALADRALIMRNGEIAAEYKVTDQTKPALRDILLAQLGVDADTPAG